MEQFNLFGQHELISEPKKRNHAGCGCFTDTGAEQKQAAIQAHFERGKSLTVLQALKQYHTTELRKIVCRLKKKGLDIISDWHQENGKNKYKIYKLKI